MFISHDIDIKSSQSNNVKLNVAFFNAYPLNKKPLIHLLYVYRCIPMIQVCVLVPTHDTDTCTLYSISAHLWYIYVYWCPHMIHLLYLYGCTFMMHLLYVYRGTPMINVCVLVPTYDTDTCINAHQWYRYVFRCPLMIPLCVLVLTYYIDTCINAHLYASILPIIIPFTR